MERPGYVFGFLRRRFAEDVVNQVGRMRLTLDQKGAVFDLPSELVDDFVAKCVSSRALRSRCACGVCGASVAVYEAAVLDPPSELTDTLCPFSPARLASVSRP